MVETTSSFGVDIVDEDAGPFWTRIGQPHAAVVVVRIDGRDLRSGYRFTGASPDEARSRARAMFAADPRWSHHPYVGGVAARLVGERLASIAAALPSGPGGPTPSPP